ncbi:MAG: GNAT family N-acetyltransferase [Anaerolineales bacterium]|nr:GNAT family N-acetyltransferase [Anaerolineales bacterium]
MSRYFSEPYDDQASRERLVELLLAHRLGSSLLVYPTIWRSLLLLTSRVWEPALDARQWLDEQGRMTGFAMLWRRSPASQYLSLERYAHPAFTSAGLTEVMLAWGSARGGEIARQQNQAVFLNAIAIPGDELEAFAAHGFTPYIPGDGPRAVYYARDLHLQPPAPETPPGWVIRPPHSLAELEAYNELYDFAAVTPAHRQELLASDEYAHLVVVDPSGAFQAYCEVSICREEWRLSDQKIGWVDYIGVRPELQGRGLGRAILLAGLQALHAWGAHSARLVTTSDNEPAVRLYERCGFVVTQMDEPAGYEMTVPPEG